MTAWQSMTHRLLGVCMRVFKEPVVIRPGLEGHQELDGIFRAQHADVDLGNGSISTVAPELDLRLADVRDPPLHEGDRVIVRGLLYRLEAPRPDGEGGVSFNLKRLTP